MGDKEMKSKPENQVPTRENPVVGYQIRGAMTDWAGDDLRGPIFRSRARAEAESRGYDWGDWNKSVRRTYVKAVMVSDYRKFAETHEDNHTA
jgi:hypothetical protein